MTAASKAVLWNVLRDVLLLLHPFMPFVTEEIWHQLPGVQGSIMTASFPEPDDGSRGIEVDSAAESEMALVSGIVTGIRNIRGEMHLPPSLQLNVVVHAQEDGLRAVVDAHSGMIVNLARLTELTVETPGPRPKQSATAIIDGASIYVLLEGIIDFEKEQRRLEKEIAKLTADLGTVSKKLGNPNFLEKAPSDVVEKVREKHRSLDEKQQKLTANLERIKTMQED